MARRTPSYIVVLLLFLVSAVVTYWARTRPAPVVPPANLGSLPSQMGAWSRIEPDPEVSKMALQGWMVEPANFLSRQYSSSKGETLRLMVVFKGRDRRSWHLSEMCFTGSGYEVTQGVARVPYAGREVPVVKFIAQEKNTGDKTMVVYWFVEGKRSESSFFKQQMSMALSRFEHQLYGWAFVRIESPVVVSEDETLQTIRDFVRTASDPLVAALTGK